MKRSKYLVFALMLLVTGGSLVFADTTPQGNIALRSDDEIVTDFAQILRNKVTNSSVFNSVSARSENGNLVISGKVRDAYLKTRATDAAEKVNGVQSITNNIEVLPASHFDDQLRVAIYRRLSRDGILSRHFLGKFAGIHIIVENARVTLVGEVSSNVERVHAASRVRGMIGVLSVDNQLTVHRS